MGTGRTDLNIWAYPELLEETAADIVGAVRAELGGVTTQSAGILTSSHGPADTQAFIMFLTSRAGSGARPASV